MKFLIGLVFLTVQGFAGDNLIKDVSEGGAEKFTVAVKGMVCSFCAQGIEKKFSAMKEVKSVSVNLDTKIVSLELNKDQKLEESEIQKTIVNAGFDVVSIKKDMNQVRDAATEKKSP